MEKEFVPYEIALALKELGFDEPCFGFYFKEKEEEEFKLIVRGGTGAFFGYQFDAPLYQQAFRWFKDNYNLRKEYGVFPHHTIIFNHLFDGGKEEQAELECLKKLIEICRELK